MSAYPTYASRPPLAPGERGLRFGTAVGLAAGASLACVLPATLRVAPAVATTEGLTRVWIALAAAVLAPMVGSILVLRAAREGLRAFAGPRFELRAYGVALGLWTLLVLLSVCGSVLRATTHHHALAGVTYAFAALVLVAGTAAGCARIMSILEAASGGARRATALALALVVGLGLFWVALRFLRVASDPASSSAAATVVDVLAFGLAAGFAARPTFAARRAIALVGPPIAVTVLVLGAFTLRDTPLRAAIDERAPAFSPVVDAIPGP